ncbi:binding-protein-dependent transport systems inner membrane component [Hymenobacter roseosalivarius DSM 11622]|uniref:Binding-protein-dependent transport systems inner membrane component n=1 Tax=Hymenobacter roseosalivarius DSM 11622 TaxID=645990 RepID=A0A1W1VTQ7_9BACT|nr:binding-protein-dependent transport systems inner membrane component [Hymenobacter roseosalivarius DSM 11622]
MRPRKKGAAQHAIAVGWLVLIVSAALLAPWLPLPFPADSVDLNHIAQPPFLPPSVPDTSRHWLGTDGFGRDVLTALVYGARTALLVSLPAALFATVVGTFLGSAAGFWGNSGLRISIVYWLMGGLLLVGAVEIVSTAPSAWWLLLLSLAAAVIIGKSLMRVPMLRRSWPFPTDRLVLGAASLLSSVPRLVLILALAAVQDASLPGIFLLLTLTHWPEPAHLVRAELLRVRTLPYIESARAIGLSGGQILWRHALPNAWRTARTAFPLSLSALIGLETTLSFLGVGLPPEIPSWGRTLAAARLDPTAWWLALFPALALAATTLALRQLTTNKISA